MKTVVIFVIVNALIIPAFAAMKCNGMAGLCKLKLNQVTFPGTHNSVAGFDGVLRYGIGIPALSCLYRNQGQTITKQLSMGIRYLDIDTCWNGYTSSAYTCHRAAYGGSIKKLLNQVDGWMRQKKNRNEVVVIHFNRDYDRRDGRLIGQDITKEIERRWGATAKRLAAKALTAQDYQNGTFPTLGDSVIKNRRIFVFMHRGLVTLPYPKWRFPVTLIGYTWTSMTFITSWGCKRLANKVAGNCDREAASRKSLVRLDLYLSPGLCIDFVAWWCNKRLEYSVDKCFGLTKKHRKTVNFVVIDYAGVGRGRDIIKVVRAQNLANIAYFSK